MPIAHGLKRRQQRILTRDGTSLAVSQWGSPDAHSTAVFLHGLCLDRTEWDAQIQAVTEHLGERARAIGYDHRGHGESSPTPVHTYTVDQLADDLDDLLAAVAPAGPVTLVGHSLGAMVALTHLSRTSHRCTAEVRGLVLCATASGRIARHGVGRLLSLPVLDGLVDIAGHVPPYAAAAVATPLRIVLNELSSRGGINQRVLSSVASSALANTSLRTAVGFLPSLRDFDVHTALKSIHAHTTVLSGGLDVLTPAAHAEAMAAAIPGAVHLHVPWAGHMLPQQVPNLVSKAIIDAIDVAESEQERTAQVS
ncbi:alpha/beta hydrolase [Mycolicibacterium fortuitum]|uniref:alpha/beta fold hydrolase n=1 Tax=Mycolicibacterium TaxID=1866885 RepID=UPI003204D7ED